MDDPDSLESLLNGKIRKKYLEHDVFVNSWNFVKYMVYHLIVYYALGPFVILVLYAVEGKKGYYLGWNMKFIDFKSPYCLLS